MWFWTSVRGRLAADPLPSRLLAEEEARRVRARAGLPPDASEVAVVAGMDLEQARARSDLWFRPQGLRFFVGTGWAQGVEQSSYSGRAGALRRQAALWDLHGLAPAWRGLVEVFPALSRAQAQEDAREWFEALRLRELAEETWPGLRAGHGRRVDGQG